MVVIEIVTGVVQVLMVPVKKQLDYVISHKKYLEDMHEKMKDLDAKKVGVESQKKQNRERRLEVPAQVSPWLEEVEQMNAKVADFPIEVPSCLDLKSRHKLGSKASKIIKEINSVLGRCPEIRGTELQIPLGRIDSTIGSTSTPSSDRSDFLSREHTFTKALEALGPNHSSHMVALWGMGGVGKTTMMKKLKEVVVEKKMFNHYVEVVIGEKTDTIAIQQAVAEYLGIDLTQTTTKSARTNKLRTWFVNNSDGGKKKFLVILDDVWQSVDMEDIGLSRLPNQGIDFKVLMTSRNKDVCTEMGVKVDSILNVGCLTDSEAQSLFLQLWEPSDDVDADLYNIGEQIVRKCCGIPIAIKTMACTLRGKSQDAWKDALYRFQHPDNINKVVPTVFKTSYDNLQDEVIEETFLLCGLFPGDFNIPTEDLLRYGWGLKLFRGLDTIREARYRLNTCIERLMHTNLLIESNVVGCVKMHDSVRDFVLDMFSKDAHAAIVNHGSKRSWPKNDISASCKRISLRCVDMAEFPSDLKFPNLTILKLMHGDESLRFPQGFYGKMEKLLVISYDRMKILPSSLVCCTNLRVLRLDKCTVRFDLSCIGNLSNLEVLNFANCGVKRLPSIIGNLKKLRILDVTGCGGLRIDNDLFKKLVSLEELYACRFDSSANAISFIGDNYNEVAERWRNISALEYEFFEEKSQLMNLSFENLERFRISVECSLEGLNRFIKSKHSFENTLELVMKKGELVGSRINELFEKTIILSLSVVDMNDLEDVSVKSLLRPQPSSFRNIRVLIFSECAELRYIFTHSVANAMSNLEDLQVYDCLVMKELIHIKSGEEGRIIFPNLKSVVLRRMPKLSGLCQNVNIIALPQLVRLQIEGLPNIISIYPKNNLAVDCFLRDEVLIPTLELLSVTGMDNLKEIWPCDFRMNEEVKLREIRVERCDKLVNLFPCNPLPLLHHLEELNVTKCGSIEVLFNLDLDCVGVIEKGSISSLRSIYVGDSGKLREVWKIKGGENNFGLPIRGFQAVERILIFRCEKFRFLFTPTTTNFDIGALINLDIDTQVESSPQEAYTLSEDTHVHSMTDVEVDSVLKEKFKAEAEIETEAEAKAQAESRFRITSTKHKQKHKHKLEAETQVQPQEKVEIEAQAQAQAQAQAKTKSQAKSETETEVQAQAYSLFRRFANNSDDGDTELQKIGEDIVRKCCNLPIAIKTMALTLRNKSKNAWKDALSRLEHLDMKTVTHTVFEMSYDNLQDGETKSIFLLCGLFPKDFTIPAEELVRYGWGLKVFDGVFTIEEARRKLNTCIERLVHANLLMDGDDEGCIKMDDLVYAFVLDMLYKVEHASIINHGSMLRWPEIYTSSSCQRISLTCEGMSEFPRDLKFPNLRILKLMHGDKLLRFPPDFYAEMKILQVISYYEIKYPLLHSSPVQFFNLRVLHLHKCSLMFDCSSIGNMLNLEVLSFASSGIEWLPYTIGKLVKLRLLDLTGCVGLRIEVGVFKNLVKLEELYTIAGGLYGRAINFTDENCNEMGERSRNLSALEFEFFRNSAQLKNMSFENLQRFKISVGRSFDGDFSKRKNSYENTLQLVTDKREIIDSNVNELFKKTEVLCLNVGDISCLEDVDMKSSHSQSPRPSSFNNVRVLMVSRCEELKYVFTLDVAKALSKLEHLQVSSCDNLEELIHIDGSGEETITFPKLKFLSLVWLQNLSVLCHNVKTIELPQLVKLELDGIPNFRSIYPKNNLTTSCLLKEEVVIPELERLVIFNMENLTEIWPREFSTSKEVKLREIEVGGCDNLVNLFPCNPMIVLRHIEEFKLKNCGSIEVLFDIDLDSIGQNGEGSNNSSLKNIFVEELGKLREVWRINGADNSRLLNPNYGFQAVENIQIENCKSFHNIFTPITTNFDLGALINLKISDCGERGRNNESVNYSQDKEVWRLDSAQLKNDPPSNEDTLQITNKISNAVIPSYLIHSFHKLRRLSLSNWEGAPEVLFEIESPKHGELVTTQSYQQRLLPYLENLDITRMEKMIHVWKCNWNEFLFYQEHERKALFHNLTTIYVKDCECIKYLFSPLMAKLLSNLKEVQIEDCGGIEKVVSEGDNEEGEQIVPTSNLAYNTSYPWLDSLALSFLPNLKCIGGVNTFKKSKFSNGYGMSWTLCQYCREISISYCDALSSAVAWSALGQIHKLEILRITRCDSMKEVFENHGTNNNSGYGSRSIDDGNGDAPSTSGLNHVIVLQLPMLRVLEIKDCDLLEHIFTFSTLQSLRNLEELIIWDCKAMEVIVKEEDDEEQTKASVSLPRIKSIALVNLPNLVGLFLGINELVLPLLDDVTIKGCPQMIVFTVGDIVAPGLKYIRTSLGKYSLEEYGLNFHVMTTAQHQTPTPILDTTGSCSFQSLIELDVKSNISLERIIPSNQLLQLQNLEKIHVSYCHEVEEVFEALEGTSIGSDESQLVVKLPNLTEVKLAWLDRLRNIWNSNQWTVFEFRNLTIVSIHGCDKLEYVFTRSMVGSLLQLQELEIRNCDHMGEVVVNDANVVVEEEEEESDGNVNEIVELPHLRSLIIDHLPCLKGFCLWKVDFSFPLLDTLKINKCQGLTVFTEGHSSTPKLREIETSFGPFYVAEEDIDSFIKIKQEEFKSNRRIK